MIYRNGEFRDKKGREILDFDVLKVFHFIGARNKKYFMYKQARVVDGFLRIYHLCGGGGCDWYDPRAQLMSDVEIVQGYPDFEGRPKVVESK